MIFNVLLIGADMASMVFGGAMYLFFYHCFFYVKATRYA